jgi:hypothetical protein
MIVPIQVLMIGLALILSALLPGFAPVIWTLAFIAVGVFGITCAFATTHATFERLAQESKRREERFHKYQARRARYRNRKTTPLTEQELQALREKYIP